jgi:hypothetical protein
MAAIAVADALAAARRLLADQPPPEAGAGLPAALSAAA